MPRSQSNTQLKANAAVIFLVKFTVPSSRDDLIPYGFDSYDIAEKKPANNKHFNGLKRLGFEHLTQVGRKREGKRDSGEQIASPVMSSAPMFLETMKSQGLSIVSARRYVDEKSAKPRMVVQLGIGFGEAINFKKTDMEKIQNLFKNVWQYCYVWDNSAPRAAGQQTVDTVNFTGCTAVGTKPVNEFFVDDEGNLAVNPFNPNARPLPLTAEAGRVATAT